MKKKITVELNDTTTRIMSKIIADVVLTFCENLAELGCPQYEEPDMWFRELDKSEMESVARKMIEISRRNNDEGFMQNVSKANRPKIVRSTTQGNTSRKIRRAR